MAAADRTGYDDELEHDDVPAGDEIGAEDTATGAPAESAQVSAERLRVEWREIQAGFVDDPRGAVQLAAEAADAAVTMLVMALRDRLATLGPGTVEDTEQLRTAMQEYRRFSQGVAEASRRLAAG